MAARPILVGDIGGTKTLLALHTPGRGLGEARRYDSADHSSLLGIVEAYLADTNARPSRACFGVAGPIEGARARITNLPWIIEADALAAAFDLERVLLLNDLEAVAHALPRLPPAAFVPLRDRPRDPDGVVALVAPGTGLGMAAWVPAPGGGRVLASEGGHVAFAPRDPLQDALLAWLRGRHGHVSIERVCSGSGIPNLYAFLRDTGRYEESPALSDALLANEDPTPVIVEAALANASPLCRAALDLFVRILGQVVGDVAVSKLPRGGIVLGGGMPPRLLERLAREDFEAALLDKGRFRALVDRMPVRVLTDGQAPLVGAAAAAEAGA